MSLSLKQGPP